MNDRTHSPEIEMYDLTDFSLHDMTQCGTELRNCTVNASTMESAARMLVRYLYENLAGGGTREKACALVRFFRTVKLGNLSPDCQDFARTLLGGRLEAPDIKCLTLLATAGILPEWNERKLSRGHQAIPLHGVEVIEQAPMISQLLGQLGVDIASIVKPNDLPMLDPARTSFNVFFVSTAQGSPWIPAQEEFVIPFKIESVLGFGGTLADGDLFVIILFSKAPISRSVADMFKTIALNAKLALLPFSNSRIFDEQS